MRLTERSSVDLPQPDGPISAVTLPLGIGIVIVVQRLRLPYQRLEVLDLEHVRLVREARVDLGHEALVGARSTGTLGRTSKRAPFMLGREALLRGWGAVRTGFEREFAAVISWEPHSAFPWKRRRKRARIQIASTLSRTTSAISSSVVVNTIGFAASLFWLWKPRS
jgi:hypothetical protein